MRIFAALLAAVAAFLLVHGAVAWRSPQPRPRRASRRRPTPSSPSSSSSSSSPSSSPSLETQLRQAGLVITPAQYRVSVVGAAIVAFLVVYALTSTASVSLVPAIAVGLAPRAYYRTRRDRILHDRVAAWPEAIRDVLTHLTVDRTVHQALVELGRSGPAPLRAAWSTYARNAAVLDTPTALAQVRADLSDPVSDHVIEAFESAYDRGSGVAVSVLASVAEQVTKDLMMREEIITAQTETRAQAVFAVILPFVMLVILVSSSDGFARFYSKPAGWVVIGFGAGLAAIGWKVIGALGKIPDEPRILARRTT